MLILSGCYSPHQGKALPREPLLYGRLENQTQIYQHQSVQVRRKVASLVRILPKKYSFIKAQMERWIEREVEMGTLKERMENGSLEDEKT
ncbi:hypothetical protein ElyMa_001406200 [Elysia marginata]|uniref:Uncharacterized protein n=1 Tax=Elysia marginata TaxID=1093978 RepID=A0AAV4IXR4_9GAST|nr:hypothetical protein ElyMa_001406200 [Elysia marginata]